MHSGDRFDFDGTGIFEVEGPGGDIDVVGAPVGHFSARVFVPPAEFVVAARVAVAATGGFEAVVCEWGLSEPHIPVEFFGDFGDGDFAAGGCTSDGAGDGFQFADASFADHGNSVEEAERHFGALLGADLEDAFGFFQHFADLLAFVDGEREWFFAVDIFAGAECFDGDFGVPVIGCDDGDDVDIFAIEQFAVIFEHFDGAFSAWSGLFFEGGFASFFDVVAIDVADGGAVAEVHGLGPDGIPAIAGTDASEHGSVIGAAERCGHGGGSEPVRRGGGGERRKTGGLEKTAAGGGGHVMRCLAGEMGDRRVMAMRESLHLSKVSVQQDATCFGRFGQV